MEVKRTNVDGMFIEIYLLGETHYFSELATIELRNKLNYALRDK